MPIPDHFKYIMLMIVFGNCLATYLVEKVGIHFVTICEQRRRNNARNRLINKEIRVARNALEQRKPLRIDLIEEIKKQPATFRDEGIIEEEVEADIGDDAKDEEAYQRRNNVSHIKVQQS